MSTAEGGLQVPLCKLIARCVEGIIYAVRKKPYMGAFFRLFLGLLCGPERTGGQSLGVCYGGSGNGNNLPSESEAVSLCKTNGIERMRIYSPYTEILQALSGTEIDLIVGVPNDSLEALADASAAADWVQSNIKDYSSNVKFRYIAVGNEVNPTGSTAPFVLPAMQYVYKAIADAGLQNQIQVSTAVDTNLLGVFDPPSAGAFSDDAKPFIEPIIAFLVSNGAPLLANIYPYFRVKFNNQSVPYALFTAQGTVVQDGQLDYQNLFDALMDALYSALEKTNGGSLVIVMSESGWPSAGGAVETLENAGTYYRNLINHVKGGTPKRPGNAIETYLFGLFDENLKDPEIERHFGLFYPDKQPKYKISFG